MSTDNTPASSRPNTPYDATIHMNHTSTDAAASTIPIGKPQPQPSSNVGLSIHQRRVALKGEDAWKRMNFLYQSENDENQPTREEYGRPLCSSTRCLLSGRSSHLLSMQDSLAGSNLSRFYVMNLKKIAAKLVMRIDPSVKNTMCKRCGTLLIPGRSSDLQVLSAGEAEAFVQETKTTSTSTQPASDDRMEEESHASHTTIPSSSTDLGTTINHDTTVHASSSNSTVSTKATHRKKRLRRHRSSGCNTVRPVHIISCCRTCKTRKRINTKPPQQPSNTAESPTNAQP